MMPLLRQSEGWVGTSDVAIFPLNDKNDKNEIKKQVIYLYVCYPPGLEVVWKNLFWRCYIIYI